MEGGQIGGKCKVCIHNYSSFLIVFVKALTSLYTSLILGVNLLRRLNVRTKNSLYDKGSLPKIYFARAAGN